MATPSWRSECRTIQRLFADALAARGEHDRAERLLKCIYQDELIEATGYRTWRCMQRNCLFCRWKYRKRFIRLYRSRLEKIAANGHRLSLLTLTIPNVPWLATELYKWLPACFKKLMRRDPFRGQVIGAITAIETEFNSDSQDFHVHIHAILIYQQCIPQEVIAEAWSVLTAIPPDGYHPFDESNRVIWIEKNDPKSIRKTVGYILKFKHIEDADAYAEYDIAVENVRLVNTYGVLRRSW